MVDCYKIIGYIDPVMRGVTLILLIILIYLISRIIYLKFVVKKTNKIRRILFLLFLTIFIFLAWNLFHTYVEVSPQYPFDCSYNGNNIDEYIEKSIIKNGYDINKCIKILDYSNYDDSLYFCLKK